MAIRPDSRIYYAANIAGTVARVGKKKPTSAASGLSQGSVKATKAPSRRALLRGALVGLLRARQAQRAQDERAGQAAEPRTLTAAAPDAPAHVLLAMPSFKIPTGRLDERDPRTLEEHPLLRQLFGLGSDEENKELLESVNGRQYRPALVTGANCASAPGTVLDGRRLRRVKHKLGELLVVEVLDGLTAEMEVKIIIHSNVASGLARRYDEQAKAALENYYVQRYGKKQGQRTDLDPTSVQSHGSESSGNRRGSHPPGVR